MNELERAIIRAHTDVFGLDAEYADAETALRKLVAEIDQLRTWNAVLEASDATLKEEVGRYHKALIEIKERYGRVCVEYETCDHAACSSSHGAWETANQALRMPEATPADDPFGPPSDAR